MITKRVGEKIPNKPGGYSATAINRTIYEHKQIQKWNDKIKKCLSKDVSDDMETKKWKCLSKDVSDDMETKKWEVILT